MAKRDQVDEVIGVEVADDDRIEIARIAERHHPANDALAAVDEDRR